MQPPASALAPPLAAPAPLPPPPETTGGFSGRRPRFVVITNVSGIEDPTGRYAGRIHHVSLLSEVLRIWADLPEEIRILLVLDEPEANLRGGNTKSVNAYQDFRYMIRKLGIAKIEIWHSDSEQYKGLREDDSEKVFRIVKDQKDAFTFTRRIRDQIIKQRVENVPENRVLTFATRGMASIDIDVDMGAILRRIAKLWRVAEIKAAVREALQDSRIYQAEYRSEEAEAKAEAAKRAEQDRRDGELVRRILADPEQFRARRGGFDRNAIQHVFGVTARDADYAALKAEKREASEKPKTPLEAAVEAVLAEPERFLSMSRRSFDPDKVRTGLGIARPAAREAAKEAWRRWGEAEP